MFTWITFILWRTLGWRGSLPPQRSIKLTNIGLLNRYYCTHCGVKHQSFCDLLVPIPEDLPLSETKKRLCLTCEDTPARRKRKGDGTGEGKEPKKKGKKSRKAELPPPPARPTVEDRRYSIVFCPRFVSRICSALYFFRGDLPFLSRKVSRLLVHFHVL